MVTKQTELLHGSDESKAQRDPDNRQESNESVNEEVRSMSQTTDNERLRATLRAIYDDMHQQNAILANKIERLRADMDQRMNAYVESQERDEAEIERLRGLAKESIAISNDPLLDDDEKVEQMRECTARALETKP